jgi:hypothetical protein
VTYDFRGEIPISLPNKAAFASVGTMLPGLLGPVTPGNDAGLLIYGRYYVMRREPALLNHMWVLSMTKTVKKIGPKVCTHCFK